MGLDQYFFKKFNRKISFFVQKPVKTSLKRADLKSPPSKKMRKEPSATKDTVEGTVSEKDHGDEGVAMDESRVPCSASYSSTGGKDSEAMETGGDSGVCGGERGEGGDGNGGCSAGVREEPMDGQTLQVKATEISPAEGDDVKEKSRKDEDLEEKVSGHHLLTTLSDLNKFLENSKYLWVCIILFV